MKKMVYEMNVEWNWIKQRPHFLAEELAKYFDITVLYQYRYNRKGLQHREVQGEKLKPVHVIPMHFRAENNKFGFDKIGTVKQFTDRMESVIFTGGSVLDLDSAPEEQVVVLTPKNVKL